jgi:hypothetical protein
MDSTLIAQLLGQMDKPTAESPDYGIMSYLKKYGVPPPYNSIKDYQEATGNHLTDEFKLPNHPTFSTDSPYSSPDMQGGTWQSGGKDRWNFQPSDFNLQQYPLDKLLEYFKTRERKGTFITRPKGKHAEGSK